MTYLTCSSKLMSSKLLPCNDCTSDENTKAHRFKSKSYNLLIGDIGLVHNSGLNPGY